MTIRGAVADAIALWSRAFPEIVTTRASSLSARVALFGLILDITPGRDASEISVSVPCPDAAEARRIAKILQDGGRVMLRGDAPEFSSRYIWVEDQFGVNWQIMSPSEDRDDQDCQSQAGPQTARAQ